MQGPYGEISVQRQAAINQLAVRFEEEMGDGVAPLIEDFYPPESADLRP